METEKMLELKCCKKLIKLKRFPDNMPHQFEGTCTICRAMYGIQDLTLIEDDFADVPAECENAECEDCKLSKNKRDSLDCPY
jgi:hypothetical protein